MSLGIFEESDSQAKDYYKNIEKNVAERFNDVNLNGLWGAPSPFSELADQRTDGNKYGQKYIEKFIKDGNFISITVGKPKFNDKLDEGMTEEILKNTVSDGAEMTEKNKEKISESDAKRLFSFETTMGEYWSYVSILCGVTAKLLGVDETGKHVFGHKFSKHKWGGYESKFLENQMLGGSEDRNYWQFIPFYNDGIIETSESVSHTSGPSSFEKQMNNLTSKADVVKEASFLSGGELTHTNSNRYDKDGDGEAAGKKGVFGKMKDALLGSGGSSIFSNIGIPDVWKDSSYDKEYNVKFKFTTPHGDPLSIYLNVIVPLCHILPFVTARQAGLSNSYTSSFIIRTYCKGMMNCSLGLPTNVVIDRNEENVSMDGLPTEIDVTLTIKDLHAMLAMPEKPNVKGVLKSNGLMGYLGTLCGMNMNKPDPIMMKKMELLYGLEKKVSPKHLTNAMSRKADDWAQNMTEKVTSFFTGY